jgi:hypothetical protein
MNALIKLCNRSANYVIGKSFLSGALVLLTIFLTLGIDGLFELVFGTSAAAPVVASIITLINDARILQRKKPVGV